MLPIEGPRAHASVEIHSFGVLSLQRVFLQPAQQSENGPNLPIVVLFAPQVLVEDLRAVFLVQKSCATYPLLREILGNELLQFVLDPEGQGRSESFLLALSYLRRQKISDRSAQELFGLQPRDLMRGGMQATRSRSS